MRAALFILFIVTAPAAAVDDGADYYPMAIGTKWTYKIGKQDDKFVWNAVKTEKVGAQECVLFEATLKGQVVGSEHLAILKDGIYRIKSLDNVVEPPVCFFKTPGKKEETWKQEFTVDGTKTSAAYTTSIEDVEVPAGKFKDALVVRTEASSDGMVMKSTIWYVKNVGMVKQFFDLGDKKITLELEKMEIPKK